MNAVGENLIPSFAIRAASWNIAAINNNPFEYWITNPNPDYESMMRGIQSFIQNPESDVSLDRIFTDEMFDELCNEMDKQSIGGLDAVSDFWKNDFSKRLAIKGFLKDKELGLKRLASMPDRITNTINLASGGTCMRPTVINAYDGGALESIDSWWRQWKEFMFYTNVQISTGKNTETSSPPLIVCKLLSPISRSKYPAISVEEQAVSIPLQILCLAILDSIFVYMVNIVSPGSRWEAVRKELCRELIQNKSKKIRSILAKDYADMDVIFIQEAAAIFVQNFHDDKEVNQRYSVLLPWNVDGKRDQNSMILVRRDRFRDTDSTDLTSTILDGIDGSWVAPGDLVAYSISDNTGRRWLLVSFHGDSNGLSTQPFMEALDTIVQTRFKDHILVVGLDANTHSVPPDMYHHSVESFCAFIADHDMVSFWGEVPDPSLHTTCSARTFLQTQLNKAMSFEKRLSQKSLKDWIVVYRHQSRSVSKAIRDNTGKQKFIEGLVLPSLQFPSDHAIVSAFLEFDTAKCGSTLSYDTNIALNDTFSGQDPQPVAGDDTPRKILPEHHKPSQAYKLNSGSKSKVKIAFASPKREKTLYDYWGIREKPVTEKIFANLKPSLPSSPSVHDMSLEQEINKICEDHYVQLVTEPRDDDLDTNRLIFSRITDKSLWILFSSRPVSMSLSKLWGQLLFVSMAMQYLLEFTLNVLAVVDVMGLHGSHFRFTLLTVRNGIATSNSSIQNFGLLVDGCIVTMPHNVSTSPPSALLDFERPVRFNGWYFQADSDSSGSDPIDYRMETSLDGFEWREIRPPPWMRKDDYYAAPFGRMSSKFVDLQPPWPWILFWCVGMLWMCVGMLLPSVLGAKGRGRQAAIAESAAVSVLGLLALVNGMHATIVTPDTHDVDGILFWAMGFELLCLAFIFYTELYTVQLAAPVFSLFGICTYFEKQCHFPNPVSPISQYLPLVWTVMPSFAALVQNIARWFIRRWVFQTLVGPERASHDAIWAEIMDSDRGVGALENLLQCSERIRAMVRRRPVVQRHCVIQDLGCEVAPDIPALENGKLEDVRSLDRLFNQASALDPFLRHKTRQLALESHGCLPVRVGGESSNRIEYQRLEDVVTSQHFGDVMWAKLKPVERAVEKLVRCYDCEVSRLLDCCRQRIVFAQPSHMIMCLETMMKDDEIEIVRIKNRFDPSYDSKFSGGFRSIIVNLRIRSSLTLKLGINHHICELQLLHMKQIEIMKCDDYHKHYLILRNCRDTPSITKCVSNTLSSINGSILRTLVSAGYSSQQQDKDLTNRIQSLLRGTAAVVSQSSRNRIAAASSGLNGDCTVDETPVDLLSKGASVVECTVGLDSSSGIPANVKDSWSVLQRVFERHFFLSMTSLTQYCGPGFNKDKVLEDAIAQTPSGAVWDTSHPIAAALCKPWMRVFIVALCLCLTFNLSIGLDLMAKNGLHKGKVLRFTAVDQMQSPGAGISSLGFLRDGCSHSSRSISMSKVVSNGTLTVTYADEISMNGWWLGVPLASLDRIPRRFYAELSKGGEPESWKKVGSSSFLWTWSGSVVFFDGHFRSSHASQQVKTFVRGKEMVVQFDMRVPWIWCSSKYVTSALLIFMTFSAFIASQTKNQMRGRVLCAFLFFGVHVAELLTCIAYFFSGEFALAILTGIYSMSGLIYGLMMGYYEHIFRQLNAICATLLLIGILVHYLYLDSLHLVIGAYFGFENRGVFEGIGLLVLSILVHVLRIHSRRRAAQVMAEFHEAYDKCWEAMLKSESACQSDKIQKLKECTDAIIESLSFTARQRGKPICNLEIEREDQVLVQSSKAIIGKGKSAVLNFLGNSLAHLAGSNDAHPEQGPLILDLDQLFAQAEGVHHLLQLKVQHWALLSNGCFPVISSAGDVTFERWEKIADSKEMLADVKWGRVKSRKRAIEKLYRSYNCDVSRLLDCCRQSIYFEDLGDLLACIKAIACDPESRIVRAKNRLRPDHDASSTAGFRNVALNLQVLTTETRRLQIDTHICEVQLVTVDFAKLKTEAGHQRYVSWRNLKGE